MKRQMCEEHMRPGELDRGTTIVRKRERPWLTLLKVMKAQQRKSELSKQSFPQETACLLRKFLSRHWIMRAMQRRMMKIHRKSVRSNYSNLMQQQSKREKRDSSTWAFLKRLGQDKRKKAHTTSQQRWSWHGSTDLRREDGSEEPDW